MKQNGRKGFIQWNPTSLGLSTVDSLTSLQCRSFSISKERHQIFEFFFIFYDKVSLSITKKWHQVGAWGVQIFELYCAPLFRITSYTSLLSDCTSLNFDLSVFVLVNADLVVCQTCSYFFQSINACRYLPVCSND